LGGLVARARKGLIVEDYLAEPNIEHIVDKTVIDEGVVSGMAAPIQMGSENFGVLYVFNRTKTAFPQSDLDTLFLIGNLAAVEIARKCSEEQLHKRTAEVMDAYEKLEKAFREIKADQDSIIRLERHAIASKVTSTLAHETRNPISAIGGFARILKRKFADDPDLSRHFDIILDEAKKLEHLVAGILKAGREVSADFQELDVHRLVDASYEATREKAHLAKIELEKRLKPVQAKVIGDKECIVMVFKELILNAIEASSKHGKVILTAYQENDWVVLSVRDEGKGIEEEHQGKIYDPLFSTKKLSSGLGLSFAKEIIEAHHGHIKFDSKVGEGTTFYLYLRATSSLSFAPGPG